jgi:hypothetical protein
MSINPKQPDIILKSLSERKPGESWILMVYGQSKSGKTYFAGTCGPRTLFINIGDGLETLKSPAFTQRYPSAREMLTVDIQETSTTAAFDAITRTIDFCMDTQSANFDTIVLDEATALRRFAMNKAMTYNNQNRSRAARTSEFVQVELGDYKIEMDMIEWFLGEYIPRFKQANKNFLMLAHERQIYGKPPKMGDEAPLIKIVPGFTGKTFPDKVPAYFDDVWRSEVVGKSPLVYRLITARSEKLLVGSRHGGIFAPEESDPNFLKLLDRIKKQIPYVEKLKVTPPNPTLNREK